MSGPLYAAVAEWSRSAGLPLAVHLAESPAESALLASGAGAFADAWRARGIPLPSPLGRTPVEWLEDHDVLSDLTLCIHVVQVTLDRNRIKVRWGRAGEAMRLQVLRFNTPDDARAAYLVRIGDLDARGYLDATAE